MADGIVIEKVIKSFKGIPALNDLSATIQAGRLTGLVGPDGAGKSTLMRLMAALMMPDQGRVLVDGNDTQREPDAIHSICGYMPQRFGLYEELSVMENMVLYARLQNLRGEARAQTFDRLLEFTRLRDFTSRLAGRLSGGMKQKLGLACALMSRPRVLLLDEPSVGVDPLSRQDLWRMVNELAAEGMAVVWSTAYLDEAERCEDVLLLNEGKLAFNGPPEQLARRVEGRTFRVSGIDDRRNVLSRILDLPTVRDGVIQGSSIRVVTTDGGGTDEIRSAVADQGGQLNAIAPCFEDAFIDLLGGGPGGHSAIAERMQAVELDTAAPVSCRNLTRRFGKFVATDNVSFDVGKGEIFGLLGPNGAGKSTTFKMLCGLLKPSEGSAHVAGLDLRHASSEAKQKLGYMAQKFSLYGLLSVQQNLDLFAGLYQLPAGVRERRIEEMIDTFELAPYLSLSPNQLPLGFKQRLALACSLMHRPAVLFLDEPTSGVDPLTRREFWTHINGLVRKGVTIMVTTHFMDEAEYCDRVAMMYRGQLIALASPDELRAQAATAGTPDPTMEQAFIELIRRNDSLAERAA